MKNFMNNQFRFLGRDEVVGVDEDNQSEIPGGSGLTRRGAQLYQGLMSYYGVHEMVLNEGVDCQVLAPGQSWQNGKIKLAFVFYPDEPEAIDSTTDSLEQDSLLDEIRQSIAQPD